MCNKKNVILHMDNIDFQNIYIMEPIKNTIIPDGEFRRIIYSSDYMTLNNITLHLKIPNAKIQKYYQKYKCFLSEELTKEVQFLIDLENHILQNTHHCFKHRKANLLEQVRNGFIKFFYTDEEAYNNSVSNNINNNTNNINNTNNNTNNTNNYTDNTNKNGNIITQSESFTLQIKISGIWETEDEYGVTYKVTSL